MKIYTTVLVLSRQRNVVNLIVDKEDKPPLWILQDEDRDSLDIIRSGLYSISGIDPGFYPHIDQAGVFEYFSSQKIIYIVYTMYFQESFDIRNENYLWKPINKLNSDSELYNIIRYTYGNKKYVQ